MESNNMTRIRIQNENELKTEYIDMAKSLQGSQGVAFTSSAAIANNAG
jgi:hypothetical protein